MENIKTFDLDSYDEHSKLDMTQELTEFNKLVIKAQKRAIEDKLTSYYKKMIDEEQYQVFNATASLMLPTLHKLKEQTENIFDVKNGKNEYCFFTVNLKPEYDNKMVEISEMIKEWTNKCIYIKDNYLYSIEQRSETSDSITGIHIHILFKKNDKAPTKIKRAFTQKFFDKYVGTHASLDFKFIADPLLKVKYIMGVKKKEKMPKVYMDRVFKDSYQLPYWENIGYDEEINNIISSDEYTELFSHDK